MRGDDMSGRERAAYYRDCPLQIWVANGNAGSCKDECYEIVMCCLNVYVYCKIITP